MKIERLIAIIMILLERDNVPTSELAEKLEVSRRTIFRDVDTLNLAGLPIVVTRGSNGGVSLMNSYKVDRKLFTPKDVHKLITSLQSYQQLLQNKEISTILTKLHSMSENNESLSHNVHYERISVDLTLNEGNHSLRNILSKIESAMSNFQYLVFNYMDKYGQSSLRKVEPYHIVFKEGSWYLQAFSMERNDYRIFKVARMEKVTISDETFSPRKFVPIRMDGSDWMEEKVAVMIKIDKSIKDKVIERFGEEYIVEKKDSEYIAKYLIVDNEEGYNILLRFGNKCEIIEPVTIREKFKRYLREIAQRYENN